MLSHRRLWMSAVGALSLAVATFAVPPPAAPKAFPVLGVHWPPKQAAEQLGLLEV